MGGGGGGGTPCFGVPKIRIHSGCILGSSIEGNAPLSGLGFAGLVLFRVLGRGNVEGMLHDGVGFR